MSTPTTPDDPIKGLDAALAALEPAATVGLRTALIAAIHSASSWFGLAELLVVFSRRYESRLVPHEVDPDRSENTSVRPQVQAILSDEEKVGGYGPPPKDTLRRLVQLLPDAKHRPAALARTAREIAEVIAIHRADRLEDFWATPVRTLHPGRGYPPCLRYPKVGDLDGVALNTAPNKLPTKLGQVEGIRLAGEAARWFDIKVTSWPINNDPLASLGDKQRPLVIATCHPNYPLEEFDAPYDPDKRTFQVDGPVNRPRQRWLLRRQMEDAVAAGASIVVIPEYGIHVDDRKDLRELVESLGHQRPRLIVAGTSRTNAIRKKGTGWVNVVVNRVVIWAGDHTWSQDKLYPAPITYRVPDFPAPVAMRESTAPGREIQVIRTPNWVVAVLICRDVLAHEIVDELAELGVNLCLVPNSSPHSGSIISSLASLRTRSQAVTVVANTPALVEGQAVLDAAFDGPFEHPPAGIARLSSERAAGPGIWVWTPTGKTAGATWHPTVTANDTPEQWLAEFTRLVNEPQVRRDVRRTVEDLMALHSYPATWRLDRLVRSERFERRLKAWLLHQPIFVRAPETVIKHGLVAITRFRWSTPAATGTWTAVLTQQPDKRWLGLFHDHNSQRSAAADPMPPWATAGSWETAFVRLINTPGRYKRAHLPDATYDKDERFRQVVDDCVRDLLALYGDGAVSMGRPGRAAVGKEALGRGLRAILKRGPRFTLLPETEFDYGTVIVQTCLWRFWDMGKEFDDESGRSTVVLVARPPEPGERLAAGYECIYDDPWSRLRGRTCFDENSEEWRILLEAPHSPH